MQAIHQFTFKRPVDNKLDLHLKIPSGLVVTLLALFICSLNISVGNDRIILFTVFSLMVVLSIVFVFGRTDAILLALFAYIPFSVRLNLTANFSLPSDLLLFNLFFLLLIIRSALKRKWSFQKDSVASTLTIFVIVVTVLSFLSSFAGVGNLSQDTRKIFYLIQYLIVFFVVANLVNTSKQFLRSIETLITVGSVVAIVALLSVTPQYFYFSNFDIWAFREWVPGNVIRFLHGEKAAEAAYSINNWITFVANRAILRTFLPFINPMALAQYLLTVFPVIVSLVVYSDMVRHKILLKACLVIIGLAILLSFSRGVWVGSVIALGVFFIDKQMINRLLLSLQRGRTPKWFFGICFTALIVLSTVIVVPMFRERLASIFDLSNDSNVDRFITWQTAWANFVRSPVIGRGLGYAESYYAHNTYLDLAVQTGIIGVTLFVLIFFSAITKLVFVRRHNPNLLFAHVALGWMGTILGLLVHFFFDNQFLFPQNGVPLMVMLSLITVSFRITRREMYAYRN
jgi:O-antigen ligase